MNDPRQWAMDIGRVILYRTKGKLTEYCTGYNKDKYGENVMLYFTAPDSIKNRPLTFASTKEAWWHWYHYRDAYPEQSKGWYGHVDVVDR